MNKREYREKAEGLLRNLDGMGVYSYNEQAPTIIAKANVYALLAISASDDPTQEAFDRYAAARADAHAKATLKS